MVGANEKMKFTSILLLLSYFLSSHAQHNDGGISFRTVESLIYHPDLQKLHHRIRLTIKARGSQELSELLDGCEGLSNVVNQMISDVDGIGDVMDLVSYNIRLSYKTKNRRYKFYAGENRMLLNGRAWYIGLRMRI